ncbi:hypothetical protein LCGC14_1629910 [marine sediment metagenome]|uniref:Uncharacterized protein n=1 Tax=marine sediment metagenome TaxID=412755 RepID=A0A0F9I304_9ZZZZ
MWASGTKATPVVVPTSSLYFQNTGAVGYDYALGDFIRDNAAGTTKIQMYARLYAAGTQHQMSWRKGGETNAILLVRRDAGNENRDYIFSWWVDVSSDRKIDYKVTTGTMNNLDVVILGGLKDV